MPVDQQPLGAYYTVRQFRAEAGEIDIDVVLHGDDGPAGAWAARAAPGDVVALWGPRTAWEPPLRTATYLLVADDTALPAVGAILEHLPGDTVVHVVIEVADDDERQPLAERDGVQSPGCSATVGPPARRRR